MDVDDDNGAAPMLVEPRPAEDHRLQPMSDVDELDDGAAAMADDAVSQEEQAPLLRVGSVVDAAAVAFGETYVEQARNGGPQKFRGTIVAAAVMDDHWNVKYDEDGEVYATEAQHLTLVSAPSSYLTFQ